MLATIVIYGIMAASFVVFVGIPCWQFLASDKQSPDQQFKNVVAGGTLFCGLLVPLMLFG